jgi:hypothetical protein
MGLLYAPQEHEPEKRREFVSVTESAAIVTALLVAPVETALNIQSSAPPDEFRFHSLPIPVVDVQWRLERFTQQALEYGCFVCVVPSDPGSEPIPADWGFLAKWHGRHIPVGEPPGILASVSDALGFLRNRLQSFLEARISGPQEERTGSGFPFTVYTETAGLRIHYSDAYYFDPTNILNAPTSPVSGSIMAGRYVFGGAGPREHPVFDFDAEYLVPRDSEARLSL